MLVQAKSNLARLMAMENLFVEERNVQTAYFDPKNRILTVPILNGNLSNELYDLLLGHEVGHALDTPVDGWHDSVFEHKVDRSILNVCEDARIEKKIKRRFPGIKPSFAKGYRELMEMDFFGVQNTNINELNFIDRINLHTKGGAGQNIQFTNEEKVLLTEVENTETFEEVVEVSRKIQEFMKKAFEDGQKQVEHKTTIKIISDDFDGESEYNDSDSPADIEIEIKDESFNNSNKEENEKDNASEEKTDNSGSSEGNQEEKETSGGTGGSDDFSSKTDKAFREKEKSLYDVKSRRSTAYCDVPNLENYKNAIIPFGQIIQEIERVNEKISARNDYEWKWNPKEATQKFIKFKNDSSKVVSYLVKEFELRKNADKQSRAKVSKTGELNMNRLHDYKLVDDIFRRMTNVPNGKSHGLVMFVDWSGSMMDNISDTIKQLLNLVMFCKKVMIPFEVYAFSDTWANMEIESEAKVFVQKRKVGELVVQERLRLLNLFSSKMKNQDFTKMASYLLAIDFRTGRFTSVVRPSRLKLNGTPLNDTIIASFNLIPEFKEENRLQIVNAMYLTDGESANLSGKFYEKQIDSKNSMWAVSSEVYSTNKSRVYFRDPVTKATQEVDTSGYSSISTNQTMALLRLLKQRANCNLIGFFVCSVRDVRNTLNVYSKDLDMAEDLREEFKKDGSCTLKDVGYDEYYFLRSDRLDLGEEEFVVEGNKTRSLVSAFSKYTGNKIASRVILNRFIQLIT